MLRLEREFGSLRLRQRRRRPQLVEDVKLEIAAQRFLDHRTIGHAGPRSADLHPFQNVLIDRERRSHLRHRRIIASRCDYAACAQPSVDRRQDEDVMQPAPLLDCAGRRRSPAMLASGHQGLPPRNKGLRYPPDPPRPSRMSSPSCTPRVMIRTGSAPRRHRRARKRDSREVRLLPLPLAKERDPDSRSLPSSGVPRHLARTIPFDLTAGPRPAIASATDRRSVSSRQPVRVLGRSRPLGGRRAG